MESDLKRRGNGDPPKLPQPSLPGPARLRLRLLTRQKIRLTLQTGR